jgi:glucokinase
MDRLFGIGFSVAGYLASDEQSLEFASYLGWPNFNLSAKLQNMFGQNVSVENVNRCIALAEIRFGTMAETKDMILIRSALGLGGVLVNEGRVLRGSHNLVGNLGHVLAVPDGELCSCGKRGCLNTVAAGWAVIHKLGAASSSYDTINKYRTQNEQLRELLGSEKMGDETVISALSEAGSTLATHLLPIIQIMNPEAICLTGPVGRHSAYAESFRKTLLQFDLNCQIVLGNEAKIITPSMASVYLALSDMVYSPNFNFNQIAQTPLEARVS